MTRSPVRHALSLLAFTTSVPMLVMGCPKKQPAAVDAEAPPPASSTPEVTELAPLTDDGGADADAAEAGHKKWGGGGYNSNQLKIKECCNAMRAQAKAMGSSPEAFQVTAIAAQCDMFAAQVGPQGNAPEFAQLRAVLKSLKLPEACKF